MQKGEFGTSPFVQTHRRDPLVAVVAVGRNRNAGGENLRPWATVRGPENGDRRRKLVDDPREIDAGMIVQ
jgi:hypothetical protein